MGTGSPPGSAWVVTATPASLKCALIVVSTLPSALWVSTPVAPDSASTPPMLRLPTCASSWVWSVNSKTSERVGSLVPGVPAEGIRPEVRKCW